MTQEHRISWLGVTIVCFGLFVLFVAIPQAITSPSNVQKLVLSPIFWPTIVASLIVLFGAILIVMRLLSPPLSTTTSTPEDAAAADDDATQSDTSAAVLRLAAAAIVMVGLVLVSSTLGLVWSAILAFILLSLIIRSPHPVASLVVAILLPLLLYGFFNHLAGVAIPQGDFITLP